MRKLIGIWLVLGFARSEEFLTHHTTDKQLCFLENPVDWLITLPLNSVTQLAADVVSRFIKKIRPMVKDHKITAANYSSLYFGEFNLNCFYPRFITAPITAPYIDNPNIIKVDKNFGLNVLDKLNHAGFDGILRPFLYKNGALFRENTQKIILYFYDRSSATGTSRIPNPLNRLTDYCSPSFYGSEKQVAEVVPRNTMIITIYLKNDKLSPEEQRKEYEKHYKQFGRLLRFGLDIYPVLPQDNTADEIVEMLYDLLYAMCK